MQFQARFSRILLRILKNIRNKSFLEFHLVYISVFLNFSGTKIEKVFPISDRFIQFFFVKFYAQITRTNLPNLWIFFDFKNYQPFSKYHARKVKFRQFACIKKGNEHFASKKKRLFFHLECF